MKDKQLVEQTNKNLVHFANTHRTMHQLSRYNTITEKECEQAIEYYHETFSVLRDALAYWTDYVGYTGLGDMLSSMSEEVSHIERDLESVKMEEGEIHLEELTNTYEEVIDSIRYYSAMVFCITFRSFGKWIVDREYFDYNKSIFDSPEERAFIYSVKQLTGLLGNLNGFICRYHRQCKREAIEEKEARNEVATSPETTECETPTVPAEHKSIWTRIKDWFKRI